MKLKILGLTLVFVAALAMFLYFFILNADFWERLTALGGWLLAIIIVILIGGIYIFLTNKR